MLDYQQVHHTLAFLISNFDEDSENLLPYCRLASSVLSEKMKKDADASDIRLLTAAAAFAYSRFLTARTASDGEFDSLRAGDITISANQEASLRSANELLTSALADAAPLLTDTAFIFGTV